MNFERLVRTTSIFLCDFEYVPLNILETLFVLRKTAKSCAELLEIVLRLEILFGILYFPTALTVC